ncbi:MAG: hypothetical protein WCR72_11075 [Bacteroidota bacterium]
MKTLLIELEKVAERLSVLKDQRQEIFDNRSERWQESEKGEAFQEITDEIDNLLDSITDFIEEHQ